MIEGREWHGKSISIHSLRVEGDHNQTARNRRQDNFNPLPPCGGRLPQGKVQLRRGYFNPLPPCGGRRSSPCRQPRRAAFQSTPSVWRETRCGHNALQGMYFNPLPPCGGRQQNCTAFRLKLSRANAILTKKNTDILLHARKNTFFLIFLRKSGCESLLLFLCA